MQQRVRHQQQGHVSICAGSDFVRENRYMTIEQDIFAADNRFFEALMHADSATLDKLLVEDFILVDVNMGSAIEKSILVPLVGSGHLKFDEIQPNPAEWRVRFYGPTAIATGRTQMRGSYESAPWSAHSRYTHVYIEDQGTWRLASAQGTPIVADS